MIEVKDLRKTYVLGGEEVHALDGVSLTIKDQEFVAIEGASGSGKSTLMNMLGCLDVPDSGEVMLDGRPVKSLKENELAAIRNEKVGFIFQQFHLLAKLTALENVELPLIYQGIGMEERRKTAMEKLMKVGLEKRMDHKPGQLSGGQQQRVAIARALAAGPSLILADEPTGNLDTASSHDVLGLLKAVAGRFKQTVVLITHDQDIAQLSDRIVHIEDGRIVRGSDAYAGK